MQGLLDNDHSIPEIARTLNLKADTLHKAVSASRLHKPKKKEINQSSEGVTKSSRSLHDLGRVQTIESLRYSFPGEWGNLLGLDRIPEMKTP